MRKQSISFEMWNCLSAVSPNQTYHITKQMEVKLPSGEYWYLKKVMKIQREKRTTLGHFQQFLQTLAWLED